MLRSENNVGPPCSIFSSFTDDSVEYCTSATVKSTAGEPLRRESLVGGYSFHGQPCNGWSNLEKWWAHSTHRPVLPETRHLYHLRRSPPARYYLYLDTHLDTTPTHSPAYHIVRR